MATEAEARARLLKVLDDAKTFDGLQRGLRECVELGVPSPTVEAAAMRFVFEGDAGALDDELAERFAQVLSRFVESPEALRLAGMLEAGGTR